MERAILGVYLQWSQIYNYDSSLSRIYTVVNFMSLYERMNIAPAGNNTRIPTVPSWIILVPLVGHQRAGGEMIIVF